MVRSLGILEYFPLKTFRDHQKEILEEIAEAYNSDYKYVLLEA
jgi:Rad3-related DNA helicase